MTAADADSACRASSLLYRAYLCVYGYVRVYAWYRYAKPAVTAADADSDCRSSSLLYRAYLCVCGYVRVYECIDMQNLL